jgi:hypothetical protein
LTCFGRRFRAVSGGVCPVTSLRRRAIAPSCQVIRGGRVGFSWSHVPDWYNDDGRLADALNEMLKLRRELDAVLSMAAVRNCMVRARGALAISLRSPARSLYSPSLSLSPLARHLSASPPSLLASSFCLFAHFHHLCCRRYRYAGSRETVGDRTDEYAMGTSGVAYYG